MQLCDAQLALKLAACPSATESTAGCGQSVHRAFTVTCILACRAWQKRSSSSRASTTQSGCIASTSSAPRLSLASKHKRMGCHAGRGKGLHRAREQALPRAASSLLPRRRPGSVWRSVERGVSPRGRQHPQQNQAPAVRSATFCAFLQASKLVSSSSLCVLRPLVCLPPSFKASKRVSSSSVCVLRPLVCLPPAFLICRVASQPSLLWSLPSSSFSRSALARRISSFSVASQASLSHLKLLCRISSHLKLLCAGASQ